MLGGGSGQRRSRQPLAPLAEHLGDVGPRRDGAFAAGLDDAGKRAQGAAALSGAGTVADAPGDHPVAQGTLGLIVGCALQGTVDPSVQIRPG